MIFTPATLCLREYTIYGFVSVRVCLSVTSRCSIEVVLRIELVFGTEASFGQSYTVFKEHSDIYKNKGTYIWSFLPRDAMHPRY